MKRRMHAAIASHCRRHPNNNVKARAAAAPMDDPVVVRRVAVGQVAQVAIGGRGVINLMPHLA